MAGKRPRSKQRSGPRRCAQRATHAALARLEDPPSDEVRKLVQALQMEKFELKRCVKEKAARLEATEEKWRSLVAVAPDCILIAKPDGTVVYANRAANDISPKTMVGTKADDLASPECRASLRAALGCAARSGKRMSFEWVGLASGGTPRFYSAWIGPLQKQTQIVALTVVFRDVTERKQREHRALKCAARLAHASRLAIVGELEPTITHEVDKPLEALMGYVEEAITAIELGPACPANVPTDLKKAAVPAERAGLLGRRLRNLEEGRQIQKEQLAFADFLGCLGSLTAREREVADLIVTGATTKQIAQRLQVTLQAIDARRLRILKKMHVEGVVHLVRLCARWEFARDPSTTPAE